MTAHAILIALGYACLGVASLIGIATWFVRWRGHDRAVICLVFVGSAAIVALLALHAYRDGRLPVFGRFEALLCYSLAISMAYLYIAIRHNMAKTAAVLLPYITILFVLAVPSAHDKLISIDRWPVVWLGIHVLAAFAGYALFTVSGFLAVLYVLQDHNLKHKRFGRLFDALPPLEALDHLMRGLIGTGFFIFTIAIASGAYMIHLSADPGAWLRDPKITATGATWCVYAALVHLQTNRDRHGRRVAMATILGLFFVLFTFLGVHALAESLHDFLIPASVEL